MDFEKLQESGSFSAFAKANRQLINSFTPYEKTSGNHPFYSCHQASLMRNGIYKS
ncbi:hypothetical protein [Leeuwenhoekiella sp. UBA1003]|uniref:hypothetical protein n=1 Tax=Leeuwenhoekiella sp. UBA1003 TaxID=1946744 RepID=UPI0025C55ECC|nr:hypothetical protein [Leeuwenhoekiella sp. UBA1003]|tara:strand:- start:27963 stop:28127 length:165 start_codon:yes stop_codon:yes gene_type:complete